MLTSWSSVIFIAKDTLEAAEKLSPETWYFNDVIAPTLTIIAIYVTVTLLVFIGVTIRTKDLLSCKYYVSYCDLIIWPKGKYCNKCNARKKRNILCFIWFLTVFWLLYKKIKNIVAKCKRKIRIYYENNILRPRYAKLNIPCQACRTSEYNGPLKDWRDCDCEAGRSIRADVLY